jgi:hypothetical protein
MVSGDPDAAPILKWLEARKGDIATGGTNLSELYGGPFRRLLIRLVEDGRAKVFPKASIESSEISLKKNKAVKSNDFHVLALAIVSGSRVVFSNDQLLADDFRNKNIINKPRGSIYKTANHAPLLKKCGRC